MKSGDVTDTLDLALQASGCDQATVLHKPRLLGDNGASYISGGLAGRPADGFAGSALSGWRTVTLFGRSEVRRPGT